MSFKDALNTCDWWSLESKDKNTITISMSKGMRDYGMYTISKSYARKLKIPYYGKVQN